MGPILTKLLPLSDSSHDRSHGSKSLAALLVLPACFLVAVLILMESAGPFWIWHNVDPEYAYLVNALKIVNLTAPGHVDHPGTPLQWLGALVIKATYPTNSSTYIIETVLADPETHMHRICVVITWLNAIILLAAGMVGYAVFKNVLPALIVQAAPFASAQIIRHGITLKPESLLILSVMALITVTLLALRPGAVEANRRGFAIAFGMVLGFGMACKINFAPLFLLPPFLLGDRKAILTFAASSLLAFLLFTLPALGAYEQFTDWIVRLFLGSGHYGGGPATVINVETYPRNIYRLIAGGSFNCVGCSDFARPLFNIVFILAVLTLVVARRSPERRDYIPKLDLQALKGVVLTQMVMVLMVAKAFPTSESGWNVYYMIPAYMLTALSGVLLYRIVPTLGLGGGTVRRCFALVFPALLVLIAITQAFGIARLDRNYRNMRDMGLSVGNERFSACARISGYSASSPSFALYNGNLQAGFPFSKQLKELRPENDFWLNIFWPHVWIRYKAGFSRTSLGIERDPGNYGLWDWTGSRDLQQVLSHYPCAVFRGSRRRAIAKFLAAEAPESKYDTSCSTPYEGVFTMGVDCQGRLTDSSENNTP